MILAELETKLAGGPAPDYISLAGSGEPTLHSGIGEVIRKIKDVTDIPVAVLTNGSLLWIDQIQEALMKADVVLPSLDAGDDSVFQYVNRPHQDILFQGMVDGLADFTKGFSGQVWLEVFLLAGVTGLPSEAKKIAALAQRIAPVRVQLNTVCRPPAEKFAFALSQDRMLAMKEIFQGEVEIISGSEPDSGRASMPIDGGDGDILALLGRRPCTSDDVARGLGMHVTEALKRLEALSATGAVATVMSEEQRFYTLGKSREVSGS